jgi:hypothetical protein
MSEQITSLLGDLQSLIKLLNDEKNKEEGRPVGG